MTITGRVPTFPASDLVLRFCSHIHHYPGSDEAPEERLILDLPLAKSLKLGPEPECPFDLDFQYKRSDPASKHTEGTKPAMLASPLKNRLIDIKAVA